VLPNEREASSNRTNTSPAADARLSLDPELVVSPVTTADYPADSWCLAFARHQAGYLSVVLALSTHHWGLKVATFAAVITPVVVAVGLPSPGMNLGGCLPCRAWTIVWTPVEPRLSG
jgi:hypothetical protein